MIDKKTLPAVPRVMLFDWHGTLVDTLDAMFSAMADMLPHLEDLQLVEQLLPESRCRSENDARLVRYIRIFRRLHPRILAERRVSRTEIFNAIFGDNREAKRIAHTAYNSCYRRHFGKVRPFQQGVGDYLAFFSALGIKLGVATNRSREFLDVELQTVDDGDWRDRFDTTVCADDVADYKPDPEILFKAIDSLGETPGPDIWYVADGFLDVETARNAGISAIFYNGGNWESDWLQRMFPPGSAQAPDAVVGSFDELVDLLEAIQQRDPDAFFADVPTRRPSHYPPPQPPPPRIEPDWHPAVARLIAPQVVLFDWHATLVDTLDAMYHAVDDMLPELGRLGLLDRMVDPADSRSPEDAKLVEYVQSFSRLHPKVRADRKISRTDIFEVLFGRDQEAKQIAHRVFNEYYRRHYGNVLPFEPKVREVLLGVRRLPVKIGVITNRDREFFEQELAAVDSGGWTALFDVAICGDDTPLRKPHPDQLLKALEALASASGPSVWYVGDSTTDVVAAKRAGMTAVFFNGAQWDLPWLQKIFPGTVSHPHKPDVVVNDFSEFWALVLACQDKYR